VVLLCRFCQQFPCYPLICLPRRWPSCCASSRKCSYALLQQVISEVDHCVLAIREQQQSWRIASAHHTVSVTGAAIPVASVHLLINFLSWTICSYRLLLFSVLQKASKASGGDRKCLLHFSFFPFKFSTVLQAFDPLWQLNLIKFCSVQDFKWRPGMNFILLQAFDLLRI
jgi:hypothetical protein